MKGDLFGENVAKIIIMYVPNTPQLVPDGTVHANLYAQHSNYFEYVF